MNDTPPPLSVRQALVKARGQFAFYASEHAKAGKLEKAATNTRFVEEANRALAAAPPEFPLRDEVRNFALTMEHRLKSKDQEYGGNSWKGENPRSLRTTLHIAGVELADAIDAADTFGTPPLEARQRVILRAVDVANYAMMIADVA